MGAPSTKAYDQWLERHSTRGAPAGNIRLTLHQEPDMKRVSTLCHVAAIALIAASLSGCKNDGQNPVMTDDRAATLSSPGNGAGNSATGATGGSATSPGAGNAAPVPGTTGTGSTGSNGAYGSTGSSGASGTSGSVGNIGNSGNSGSADMNSKSGRTQGATDSNNTSATPQPSTPPAR